MAVHRGRADLRLVIVDGHQAATLPEDKARLKLGDPAGLLQLIGSCLFAYSCNGYLQIAIRVLTTIFFGSQRGKFRVFAFIFKHTHVMGLSFLSMA